jgi:hypothetical protein
MFYSLLRIPSALRIVGKKSDGPCGDDKETRPALSRQPKMAALPCQFGGLLRASYSRPRIGSASPTPTLSEAPA